MRPTAPGTVVTDRSLRAVAACFAIAALAPWTVAGGQTPPAAHAAVDSSRLRTARELLEAMDMMSVLRAGNLAMVKAQTATNPAMAPFEEVLIEWAEKHLTWEVMAPPMSAAYAAVLTETEMRELIAFYRTPTGRKVVAVTPELTQRGAAIGSEVAQQFMPQLEVMVRARAEELSKKTGSKP